MVQYDLHSELIVPGLFAPSAGQHLRDEQRRRRSQYDRGTSLAEHEEYSYDEDLPYRYVGYSQCQSSLIIKKHSQRH